MANSTVVPARSGIIILLSIEDLADAVNFIFEPAFTVVPGYGFIETIVFPSPSTSHPKSFSSKIVLTSSTDFPLISGITTSFEIE
jgi:hypothetical protein